MAGQPSLPDREPPAAHDAPPRMPRWVKVLTIVTVVLMVLLVFAMLIGGGEHGPGRHLPPAAANASGVLSIGAVLAHASPR